MKKFSALALALLMLLPCVLVMGAAAGRAAWAPPAALESGEPLPFEEDAGEALIVPPVPARDSKHSVSKFIKWALKRIDPESIPTNANLYLAASSCGATPWEYLYGTIRTSTSNANILSRYNNYYTTYMNKAQYDEITDDWSRSTYATDCQGLLDAFMTYEESVSTDINAQMNYANWCTSKGEIGSIDREWKIGEAVFIYSSKLKKMGHVGWICGFDENGEPMVVEARGLAFGVVVTRLSDRGWTHRGLMTVMFDYDAAMSADWSGETDSAEELPERSSGLAPRDVWDGSTASSYAGGSGTAEDPYRIDTASQLARLAYKVNSGSTYNGKYFVLNNDLWLNDTTDWTSWDFWERPANEWTPIGAYTNNTTFTQFRGSFDGQGHTIYGLFFSENKKSCYGLFGYVGANADGCIKNLRIDDSFMEAVNNVGAIVGYMTDYGRIENCRNSGKVRGSHWTGGIVGFINNTSGVTVITGCTNDTTVKASLDTGGIVGRAHENCSITYCNNTASYVKGYIYTGGIVGRAADMTVSRCRNHGEVRGTDMIAGIVGSASNCEVSRCYNACDFTARYRSGGIVGNAASGSVKNCFNTGDIACIERVGGIVGLGTDVSIECCYDIGTVSAKRQRGGIIGTKSGTTSLVSAYMLENCCAYGNSYGEYLPLDAFASQDPYAGFDFDSVWKIDPATAYPFAELRSIGYTSSNIPEYTPQPTPTPSATPTASPTATPEPTPTPTVTPEPTEDPTPTPEPTEDPTPTPEPTDDPTPEPTDGLLAGDVDGSGIVDAQDALMLMRFVMGLADELPAPQNADYNMSGDIDAADALELMRSVMDLG